MKTSEVLRKALELLGPNGEKWSHLKNDPGQCPFLAISQVCDVGEGNRLTEKFAEANNLAGIKGVWDWNDKPERTWPEVESAFKQAIATAERGEG